jgi:hypothetical protein
MRSALPSSCGPFPEKARDTSALGDLRFSRLVPDAHWRALPENIRRRFSERVADGESVVYTGVVVLSEASRAGRIFAWLGRLIGGPLPISRDVGVATIVTVTEDSRCSGQVWTRIYCRRSGFPQVIHSSKRFAGPTGLEEHVGRGVGMALGVSVESGALVFRSRGYFVELLGIRLPIPGWLTPGDLTVAHAECGSGRFRFSLEIDHPLLGALIRQTAIFTETTP